MTPFCHLMNSMATKRRKKNKIKQAEAGFGKPAPSL
jgi:hypothetical protein